MSWWAQPGPDSQPLNGVAADVSPEVAPLPEQAVDPLQASDPWAPTMPGTTSGSTSEPMRPSTASPAGQDQSEHVSVPPAAGPSTPVGELPPQPTEQGTSGTCVWTPPTPSTIPLSGPTAANVVP